MLRGNYIKPNKRVGRMAQRLRVHIALPEIPSSISSNHTVPHNHHSNALFWCAGIFGDRTNIP